MNKSFFAVMHKLLSEQIGIIVFLLFAAYLLIFPEGEYCSIMLPPDCMEYTFGMDYFVNYSEFSIGLNGNLFPSRYSPWFSMVFLFPGYALSGLNISALKFIIGGYAILALYFIYLTSKRLKCRHATWIALVLTLLSSDFIMYSRMTMTEIPYFAMLMILLFQSLRLLDAPELKRRDILVAGLLTMLCGMIRSTGIPMILFAFYIVFIKVKSWRTRFEYCFFASVPIGLYEIANAFFNYGVFGSITRTGYNFWVPIPMDIPELAFNLDYIWHNIKALAVNFMFWIVLAMMIICAIHSFAIYRGKFGGRHKNAHYIPIFLFISLQLSILCAVYLPYYWDDTRFFFFIPLILFAPTFTALNQWLNFPFAQHRKYVIPLLWLTAASVAFMLRADIFWFQGVLACRREREINNLLYYRSVVPEKSALLSSISPPIAEKWFVEGHDSLNYPVIRRDRMEYSTAMLAVESINGIEPRPDRNSPRLIPEFIHRGICKLPLEHALSDGDDLCGMLFSQGYRIFICGEQYEQVTPEVRAYIDDTLARYGCRAVEFARRPRIKSKHYNSFRYRLDRFLLNGDSMICKTLPESVLYEIIKD